MNTLRRHVAVAIIALILASLVATCALAQTGSGAGKTGLGKHLGEVHYVAIGGSNRGAGTAEEPWASLQHAVDRALPGDSILIYEGTYAGARIEVSGTREAPITMRACTGEEWWGLTFIFRIFWCWITCADADLYRSGRHSIRVQISI